VPADFLDVVCDILAERGCEGQAFVAKVAADATRAQLFIDAMRELLGTWHREQLAPMGAKL